MPDPIQEQLAGLIEQITERVRNLLGDDLADLIATRIETRAEMYAAQLLSSDRKLAAQTAIDLACLLPDNVPVEFWATPLGQAIARTYEIPQTVTMIEAAKILGISRDRVYKLARRGKLAAVPGGVALASVLDRLAEAGDHAQT